MRKKHIEIGKLVELIKAKADTLIEGKQAFLYIAKWLDLLPPADVEEVATGQWVTKYTKNGYHKECSVCGARWMLDSVKHICVETPRCYNCGARLKGE